mmetsp:Transcript_7771/g.22411  ORF Transcript_7771/g.22411 Transcript_7771/m.22411 type:complete len:103 (-) Transcript_7771:355-663(-)
MFVAYKNWALAGSETPHPTAANTEALLGLYDGLPKDAADGRLGGEGDAEAGVGIDGAGALRAGAPIAMEVVADVRAHPGPDGGAPKGASRGMGWIKSPLLEG